MSESRSYERTASGHYRCQMSNTCQARATRRALWEEHASGRRVWSYACEEHTVLVETKAKGWHRS